MLVKAQGSQNGLAQQWTKSWFPDCGCTWWMVGDGWCFRSGAHCVLSSNWSRSTPPKTHIYKINCKWLRGIIHKSLLLKCFSFQWLWCVDQVRGTGTDSGSYNHWSQYFSVFAVWAGVYFDFCFTSFSFGLTNLKISSHRNMSKPRKLKICAAIIIVTWTKMKFHHTKLALQCQTRKMSNK